MTTGYEKTRPLHLRGRSMIDSRAFDSLMKGPVEIPSALVLAMNLEPPVLHAVRGNRCSGEVLVVSTCWRRTKTSKQETL